MLRDEDQQFLLNLEEIIKNNIGIIKESHLSDLIKKKSTRSFMSRIKVEGDSIVEVDLSYCFLSSLPESLKRLKSLRKVDLSHNELKDLPYFIENLKSLQSLNLSNNKLKSIPDIIQRLTSLRILDLSYNKLASIPGIKNLPSLLEELNLSNNNINQFSQGFFNKNLLKSLDISGNPIHNIPESLFNLEFLEKLYISECQLLDLHKSIEKFEWLRVLDLSDNKLISLPRSIGKLRNLEELNVESNKLLSLPKSLSTIKSLKKLKIKNNIKLEKGTPAMFKSMAIKSSGREFKRLMVLAESCERALVKHKSMSTSSRLKPYFGGISYASIITILGIIIFIFLDLIINQINPQLLWIFFYIALTVNFIIGATIISTLSGYYKKFVDPLGRINPSKVNNNGSFRGKIRRQLFSFFDIFVFFCFIWSIRATVKRAFNIELISAINFAFEYAIPQLIITIWVLFGYNLDLTFLENLDLFLTHYIIRLFSSALVFWALYRSGLSYIKKNAFEEIEHKKLKFYLVLGIIGALSISIMNYSNLNYILGISYFIGITISSCLFIWDICRDKRILFFFYIYYLCFGIFIVWFVGLWNLFASFLLGVILVSLFLIIRAKIEH